MARGKPLNPRQYDRLAHLNVKRGDDRSFKGYPRARAHRCNDGDSGKSGLITQGGVCAARFAS